MTSSLIIQLKISNSILQKPNLKASVHSCAPSSNDGAVSLILEYFCYFTLILKLYILPY